MKLFSLRVFAALLLCLLLVSFVQAVPGGFVEDLVANVKYQVTNTGSFATASNGDTLLFLGSKNGKIYVIVNPNETPDEQHLLLDLPVCTNGERGVQTLLPHPDFDTNGYLYIYRTELKGDCDLSYETGPQNRLSRFTVSIGADRIPVIDTSTEVSLFRGPIQNYKYHNGGGMAFGNDSYIYITIGDGGLHQDGHSQNPKTLNGAVLR